MHALEHELEHASEHALRILVCAYDTAVCLYLHRFVKYSPDKVFVYDQSIDKVPPMHDVHSVQIVCANVMI